MKTLSVLFLALILLPACGRIIPSEQSFSYEDKDWGVQPTNTPKTSEYDAPTPRMIPGARVIRTQDLKALLDSNKNVIVIDVANKRSTVPGALSLAGAGLGGEYADTVKSLLAAALEKITNGDKTRPLVFMCVSSECWLSYNATLYAVSSGYTNVNWYRGGLAAWKAANLDVAEPQQVHWILTK